MNASGDRAVYRVRKVYRQDDRPKKYRHTLELIDDRTRELVAACDLIGQATFSTLTITDGDGRAWQMKPNRRVMPSRWTITDPDGQIAVQLDAKTLGKLVNPLYKTALAVLDGDGNELHRLVDPRTNIPDQIFGLGPGEWALMTGERAVAKVVRLSRRKRPPTGFLGKLRGFLQGSDQGIVSAGGDHVLAGPVALGMLMIFNELWNTAAE